MGTAFLHPDAWSRTWHGFWHRIAWQHGQRDCVHSQHAWRRLHAKPATVLLEGSRYCVDRCLEHALRVALQRARSIPQRAAAPHRVPLGLLLLSRQQLTAEQLRAALDAQRNAGRGRMGEWLQTLGFASEQQVTAALARQWSCPVLRANPSIVPLSLIPHVPFTLLASFAMIPVNYVEATRTLHIAFGEGLDYSVLYAIEQMTGCHTEACMAAPSFVRSQLEAWSGRREHEAVFECIPDGAEFSRIIGSYCARLATSEIRIAGCGSYVWARLLRGSSPPQDLLLHSSHVVSPAPPLFSPYVAAI